MSRLAKSKRDALRSAEKRIEAIEAQAEVHDDEARRLRFGVVKRECVREVARLLPLVTPTAKAQVWIDEADRHVALMLSMGLKMARQAAASASLLDSNPPSDSDLDDEQCRELFTAAGAVVGALGAEMRMARNWGTRIERSSFEKPTLKVTWLARGNANAANATGLQLRAKRNQKGVVAVTVAASAVTDELLEQYPLAGEPGRLRYTRAGAVDFGNYEFVLVVGAHWLAAWRAAQKDTKSAKTKGAA